MGTSCAMPKSKPGSPSTPPWGKQGVKKNKPHADPQGCLRGKARDGGSFPMRKIDAIHPPFLPTPGFSEQASCRLLAPEIPGDALAERPLFPQLWGHRSAHEDERCHSKRPQGGLNALFTLSPIHLPPGKCGNFPCPPAPGCVK